MKNKFISLLAATTIAAITLLGGCSCAGDEALAFSISVPENETLTYKAEYREDDIFKKDASLDGVFTFEYGTGSLIATCKKVSDRGNIESDIKDLLTDTDVFELTTRFAIDLTLKIGENEYSHTEKIDTVSYVASSGMSLAPLYAKEEAEYFMISANGSAAGAIIVKTETETFYDQDTYRSFKTYKSFEPDADETTITLEDAEKTETDEKYTFRAAIDNTELLFALRGVSPTLAEKGSTRVPVISPAYNGSKPVLITNEGVSSENMTLNYNGATITENVKYNNLNFRHDSTNTAGELQYITVQTEGAGALPNLSLPLKYTKPLIVYGSFTSMGSLVFTLTDIVR